MAKDSIVDNPSILIMISVIICTYNREKYIYETLRRVACNNFNKAAYEIILVNNNSTDSTDAECQRFMADYPDTTCRYYIETNQGLSFARNRGIKESNGGIVVFLDDDSYIESDYLANLHLQMENHPEAAAFGGKIIPQFESGVTPRWICKWTYSWVSAIDKGSKTCEFSDGSYPIGANMGFRRKTIDKIGSFNTALGRTKKNLLGGEEKDIFNRLRAEGGHVLYFPNITIHHVIPDSRTTKAYIEKLGFGVGTSEYIRCSSNGTLGQRRRSEIVKWGATFVLWALYLLKGNTQVGPRLYCFRKNVSKALFAKECPEI